MAAYIYLVNEVNARLLDDCKADAGLVLVLGGAFNLYIFRRFIIA